MLSCHDWIVVTGTLSATCYAGGMMSFLSAPGIRIFDYPRSRIVGRSHQGPQPRGWQQRRANESGFTLTELVSKVRPSWQPMRPLTLHAMLPTT